MIISRTNEIVGTSIASGDCEGSGSMSPVSSALEYQVDSVDIFGESYFDSGSGAAPKSCISASPMALKSYHSASLSCLRITCSSKLWQHCTFDEVELAKVQNNLNKESDMSCCQSKSFT